MGEEPARGSGPEPSSHTFLTAALFAKRAHVGFLILIVLHAEMGSGGTTPRDGSTYVTRQLTGNS